MSNPVQFLHPQIHKTGNRTDHYTDKRAENINADANIVNSKTTNNKKMAAPKRPVVDSASAPAKIAGAGAPVKNAGAGAPAKIAGAGAPVKNAVASTSVRNKSVDKQLSESEIRQMREVYPKLLSDYNSVCMELDKYKELYSAHRDTENELVSIRRKLDRSEETLRSERARTAECISQFTTSQMEINKLKEVRRGLDKLNAELRGKLSAVPRCVQMMAHVDGLLHVCSKLVGDQPDVHKEILVTRDTVKTFARSLSESI
ncbi:MAG: hypothetical protein EB015_17590 [Methylocystaceae bacterium]|nr:hypothetical protein [Methylocystaceae bacterium]